MRNICFEFPKALEVVNDTRDCVYCMDYSLFAVVQLRKVDIIVYGKKKSSSSSHTVRISLTH